MVDEAEIHRMAKSADVKERIKAADQFRDDFASFSNKNTAWDDLHRLTQDEDSNVRLRATDALGCVFSYIPYKETVWSDLHRLTQDKNEGVRWMAVCALESAFSDIPDKDAAWSDLHRLTQDKDSDVRRNVTYVLESVFSDIPDKNKAWSDLYQLTLDGDSEMRWVGAGSLGRVFSNVPNKNTAWSDLHRLIQNADKEVRQISACVIESVFSDIPDKNAAWSDFHQLTKDEDSSIRWMSASALGRVFSDIPDKSTAWSDLHRLTQDKESNVQMHAYHSLGSASVYKATETDEKEEFRDELKKAIDYFEKSSRESVGRYYNPARFCLPFYRSYYAVISEKHETEAEVSKYLDEAKKATGESESRESLIKAVENLANALKEAQKPLDFGETKDHLKACRQYCDHTADLADSARGKSPVAAAAIMQGIPIVRIKVKKIIAEIQEKAQEACQKARGTSTEEIACAVNQEVQKWRIDDQKEMTQKVDSLVFCLKSKIPDNPQNKHIHEEIDKIREESNMNKQYEMVSLLIALIPTASVHTGDVINADVKASGESQVVVKGNENKNASYNTPTSKKSLINWINSPATIAAFVGFMCAEIGTYYYPVTYNHLISVGLAGLVFIIVAIFDKE